jgi:hypothetical protein
VERHAARSACHERDVNVRSGEEQSGGDQRQQKTA